MVQDISIKTAIDLKVAEQRFFWQRFVAFSAINAGFVASYGKGPGWLVPALGLVASLVWVAFLWRSHKTNENLDPPYYLAKRLALDPLWEAAISQVKAEGNAEIAREFESRKGTAFLTPDLKNWLNKITVWGTGVAVLGALLWLLFLFFEINS